MAGALEDRLNTHVIHPSRVLLIIKSFLACKKGQVVLQAFGRATRYNIKYHKDQPELQPWG